MTGQRLMGFALCSALLAHACYAIPTLSVYSLGLNGSNNREFAVDVAIDLDLGPSSLAVELAFAVDDTDLVDIVVNSSEWAFDNIGNNPFTGTETEGLWIDLNSDQAFGAFGSSNVFVTEAPIRLFTIETLGSGTTTLRYGLAASGQPTGGDIIAQTGPLYRGYTGSVTVPEPASVSGILVISMFAPAIGIRRRFVS